MSKKRKVRIKTCRLDQTHDCKWSAILEIVSLVLTLPEKFDDAGIARAVATEYAESLGWEVVDDG